MDGIPVPQRSIWLIMWDALKLWVISLPRIFPLALLLVAITTLTAYHCFGTIDPNSGIILSADKARAAWYMIPVYLMIPLIFLSIMYDQLDRITHHDKSFRISAMCPFHRFIALVMVLIWSSLVLIFSFVLFIIPGIIMLVIMQFYLPVVILEKKGWYTGFQRACDLVWGHWWRSMLILFIPLFVFISAIYTLYKLAYKLLTSGALDDVLAYQLTVNSIFSVLLISLIVSLVYTQYQDLKRHQNDPETELDKTLERAFSIW